MHTVTITWSTIHEHGDLWLQHHRLRRKAFIERQCWDLPCHDGIEFDQYDTPWAYYVLVVHNNRVVATTRMIPSTYPIMVRDLWPEMLGERQYNSDQVFEATRFAVEKDLTTDMRRLAQLNLIAGVQRFGIKKNAHTILGVMPLWIFKRVLQPAGVQLAYPGSALKIEGQTTTAAEIRVCQKTLNIVHAKISELQKPLLQIAA